MMGQWVGDMDMLRRGAFKFQPAEENDAFKLLGRLDESKFTFPTVKASAQERDKRKAHPGEGKRA